MYNENGKLEEWWTKETSEGFDERQKCISKQYSKYTIDDGKGGKAYVNVCPNSDYHRIINDLAFHRVNCKSCLTPFPVTLFNLRFAKQDLHGEYRG